MNSTPTIDRLDVGLVELKFAGGSSAERTFSGYGAVFGNVDSYGDVIAKGAFERTLGEYRKAARMPKMLAQHGGFLSAADLMPIGVWTKMAEDETGLAVEGRLSDTPRGNEAYTLLKDGAIDGLSIGFVAKRFTLGTKPDEPRRTLDDVDLHEISLVSFPANNRAQVTAIKSAVETGTLTARMVENALRSTGLPARFCKALIAGGWRAATTRGGGDDVDAEAVEALASTIRNHNRALRSTLLRNSR